MFGCVYACCMLKIFGRAGDTFLSLATFASNSAFTLADSSGSRSGIVSSRKVGFGVGSDDTPLPSPVVLAVGVGGIGVIRALLSSP